MSLKRVLLNHWQIYFGIRLTISVNLSNNPKSIGYVSVLSLESASINDIAILDRRFDDINWQVLAYKDYVHTLYSSCFLAR